MHAFLIPEWLRSYRVADIPADLAAGAAVAVVLAPQAMAYALLAGLPPVVGLYAATVPLIAYALVGSSRHLAVGPVAIISLLVHVACGKIAAPGTAEYVAVALQLALLVGLVQLALGLFRAGSMVNFLSRAAIGGFTSAAALLIGLSQLQNLLGIAGGGGASALELAVGLIRGIGETHLLTFGLGLAAVAVLIMLQLFFPRLPAPLAVVAGGTLVTGLFHLDQAGVKTVGNLPHGFPPLGSPVLSYEHVIALLPTALTIALIGYLESFAVAGSIAGKERYRLDPNRELMGL
ncbi:MAG: SulP family inorganic anion transporter, partial [Syntrophales bacterium]|nr:SulP family inorganic anion transporter [Syntrophales bacterium]